MEFLWLLLLAPVAFIQNMFFTLVSRSRNSNDPGYHRYCAWGSNGVWFVCQVLIVKNIWSAIHAGNWWYAIIAGIVYSLATTEGSVLMMKRLIKTEKGKRRVGGDKVEKLEAKVKDLEADLKSQVSELKFLRDKENNTYERTQVLERMIVNGMKSLELRQSEMVLSVPYRPSLTDAISTKEI